jgi:WD40 repeat protein
MYPNKLPAINAQEKRAASFRTIPGMPLNLTLKKGDIDTIKQFAGYTVTQINCSNRVDLTDSELQTIVETIPNLERLDLQGCVQLTDQSIQTLCEKSVHLKQLNISQCKNLTDRAIAQLVNKTCLNELVLNGLSNLKLETLRKLYSKGIKFCTQGVYFSFCLSSFKGHKSAVSFLKQLSNGRLISESCDRTIKLWNAANGTCLWSIAEHTKFKKEPYPDDAAYILELKCGRLVSLFQRGDSGFNPVILWDIVNQSVEAILLKHTNLIQHVVYLSDGRLVLAGLETDIKVWNLEFQTCELNLHGHTASITCLLELSDGNTLASGSDDNKIKLWDITMGVCIDSLVGHTSFPSTLVELSDGRLASGSNDWMINIWDLTNGSCLKTFRGHTKCIQSLLELNDNKLASTQKAGGIIKIWDTISYKLLYTLETRTPLSSILELNDGRLAVVVEDSIQIWNITPGICLAKLIGHTETIRSLIKLKDGKLASASSDKTIKLWVV